MNNEKVKSLTQCIAREWNQARPNIPLIMALSQGLTLGLKSRDLQGEMI